jgi:hypothetical protein
MSPNLMHALVAEHQAELERQAGCCTPTAEHRRLIARPGFLARVTTRRHRPAASVVCCA